MVQMPMWSEYKVTFFNSLSSTLDFLISKGYYPSEMNSKYFTFDPFQNYKSCDLETSHIGILQEKQIKYITEERFDAINKMLTGISIDTFEYAFSKQNKGDTFVILKRGVYIRFMGSQFQINLGPIGQIDFNPMKGEVKMCRLDLVKIVEDERVGWIPFKVPEVIDLTETRISTLELLDRINILSDLIITESENNKKHIDELTEHNKQLSSRLCDVENIKVPPPIILV
jgi:hypothetical protein